MVNWYWLIIAFMGGFIIGKAVTIIRYSINPTRYMNKQDAANFKGSKICGING